MNNLYNNFTFTGSKSESIKKNHLNRNGNRNTNPNPNQNPIAKAKSIQQNIPKPKYIDKIKKTQNKNMEWGTVTWKLFHWLAANIDEEFYAKSHKVLHGIIRNILYNLPCPTCRNHAIEFSKQYDIGRAKTKAQFIQYFYFFHNKVNTRKSYKIPDRSILEMYTKMNGVAVINDWVQKFKNNLGINMNDFMNKQNIENAKGLMLNFINNNKSKFANL